MRPFLVAVPLAALVALPLASMPAASAAGGTTWTARTAPSAYWAGVAYGAGTYVAVASGGTTAITSPDGITWSSTTAPSGTWVGVIYDGAQFVSVGTGGSARAMTSPDGVSWTAQPGLSTAGYDALTMSDDTYVAVGQQWVAYSNDAVTWTEVNVDPSVANQWRAVAFGDDTFVALNYNSGTGVPVMTSNDGVSWTQQTSGIPVEQWQSVIYAGGQFVAVGGTGTNRVMTSNDGVNWTLQTAPGSEYWRAVAYAGGQYVAVGHSGAVMTSPDAITWTSQSSGNTAVWRAVSGGPQFVAVGQTSGTPVMSSFIYPAPTVSAVSPLTGSTAGGDLLTIDGTDFIAGASVEVGGATCGSVTLVSATQLTCISPAGAAGAVNVTVANPDSQSATDIGGYTFVVPPPPPPPTYPASAPLEVTGVAGDGSVSVSWSAPVSSGSFPVSSYQVRSSPAGGSCLVAVTSCEVTGLANGVGYSFTVRALNGAGWGPWSRASAEVRPVAPVTASIVITGARGEVRGKPGIVVTGVSTLELGAVVRPWVRFPGQTSYVEGSAQVLVDESGGFTWERRTGKKTYVYMATDSVDSNRIVIRP